jgi:hypothetical protein
LIFICSRRRRFRRCLTVRERRRLSQLELALEAEISTRHT